MSQTPAGRFSGRGALILTLSSAQALLIDNGSITLDTGTGLEWLDLTESRNRSFDDVAGQFGAGGDFAGWRHATFSEVSALFVTAGLPDGRNLSPASTAMLQTIQLFGQTLLNQFSSVVQVGALGSFDDTGTGTDALLQGVAGFLQTRSSLNPKPDFETADIISDNFVSTLPAEIYGHWLVRSSVTSVPVC